MKPSHASLFAGLVLVAAVLLLGERQDDSAVERAAGQLVEGRAEQAQAPSRPRATTAPVVEQAEPEPESTDPVTEEFAPELPMPAEPEFQGEPQPIEDLPADSAPEVFE